jgi:RHS repeat-associated protein
MPRLAHIQHSPDKPRFGIQPTLSGRGVTDRPTPLLLEEKGPGDEVHATKERPLMDLTYSYDSENNITGISNSAFAVNGLGGNYSYNYEYDDMYRLVNAGGSFTDHKADTFRFGMTMSYSPGGNILSKNMDALTYQSGVGDVAVFYENTYAYNYSQPHAISQINGSGGGQDLHWDLNGNLTRHIRTEPDLDRRLCWDEENRLTAVRDQNHLSAYIYDAGGERVWKLTGQVQQMYVDGMGYVDVVDLNNKTLYASPYLVYNEQGYSKHYYAGAERVSSRIGGGMQDALVDPLNSALPHLSDHDNYNAITSDLYEMLMRAAECAGMTRKYVSMAHVFGIIYETTGWSNPEPNWYIYHSDHLGSSAFLTDASGDPTQHLQYMPFGETFVEQRSITSYYTPYTFSAKERDTETGYSYFGARYYDADISVWLSVDPMGGKYPYQSGYCYVGWRPIMVIDPNGEDEWEVSSNGRVTWIRESETHILYVVDSNGNRTGKSLTLKDRAIFDQLAKGGKISKAIGNVKSQDAMIKAFMFLAANTDVEWRVDRFKENKETKYALGSNHTLPNPVGGGQSSPSAEDLGHNIASVVAFVHSHQTEKQSEEKSSMGWIANSNGTATIIGPSDCTYKQLKNLSNTLYYTYFPKSGNLWLVRDSKEPAFIRNIKNDYKRFFFGTLNTN